MNKCRTSVNAARAKSEAPTGPRREIRRVLEDPAEGTLAKRRRWEVGGICDGDDEAAVDAINVMLGKLVLYPYCTLKSQGPSSRMISPWLAGEDPKELLGLAGDLYLGR